MDEEVLVSITVSRKEGKIAYKVDCAKELKSEELAHFLDEIIGGICTWKPEVCEETVKTFVGEVGVLEIGEAERPRNATEKRRKKQSKTKVQNTKTNVTP